MMYIRIYQIASFAVSTSQTLLAGGIEEPGEWSTVPDPDVAKEIYEKCVDLVPALKGSEVVGGWACLRPGRETVRLEIEDQGEGSPTVIHNYGQSVFVKAEMLINSYECMK